MTDNAEGLKDGQYRWVRMRPLKWTVARMADSGNEWRVYLVNSEGSFSASNFQIGPRIQPPQGDEG